MPIKTNSRSSDLHGAGKLTVDAIVGVTDIVESMHHTIASLGGMLAPAGQTQASGIAGLVYRNIRSITALVGKGLDLSLNRLGAMSAEIESSPGREAVLSTLNGVLGDHLVARNNSLAISMRFRHAGKSLGDEDLAQIIAQSNGKVVLMVHGSCMNDLQWDRDGHSHGAALFRDLGITPIYLHYNTGLHTSENGRQLAGLLESLLAERPLPIDLFIVAHSMGGLVSRSACYYGQQAGHSWLKQLRKMVLLGTPHHGAPLEKGGNWLENILKISPYSAPFARLAKIRSNGVLDLRYGNVVEEDWKGQDPNNLGEDRRIPTALPAGVSCYALAGTIGKKAGVLGENLIGDGLVTVNSSLGRHKNPQHQLSFPQEHQWVGREINHFDLLNHPEVYTTLKNWLSPL